MSWLIDEFSERHRPAGNKKRRLFSKEVGLLMQRLRDLGDPMVDELSETDCQTFRAFPGVGPVKVETLIRRLRQIWRWANGEGLIDRECPWLARTQETQIRAELAELVARFLPENTLQTIRVMAVADPANRDGERQDRVSLSTAVRQAARDASQQMQRDGRPDLIPALRRAELAWFLDVYASNSAGVTSRAELLLGHARIEHVLELRAKARTRKKLITWVSDASDDNGQ
ncbi:hypothetical protein E2553_18895 [Paraburkholderia dipogonis]|uniref:Uncharacterized protein n=1 Tax=Paraburkholderia dipogonis TaxID=1211383 RepID=A0A4Y8NBJ5_9BURK|nr:hypothetical protein [Paraburkholderia dipogonis]TFE46923.1 hypothetical protein E2553_18895 [Paraburkholderia dipogonis]